MSTVAAKYQSSIKQDWQFLVVIIEGSSKYLTDKRTV